MKRRKMSVRCMMGTTAIHKLGDISRDEPDLCYIHEEDSDNYIGNWATGFGFIDVRFPKSTTRELTPEETARYQKRHVVLNGVDMGPAVPKDRAI
jgi:hypothetical protein